MSRLRQVLLAIPAVGLAAALALYGVPREDLGAAVIDATVVLRQMGKSQSAIVNLLTQTSGATHDEVAPVVALAHGRVGRDPRSLRTATLTVLVDAARVPEAIEAYAQAFCAPLVELGGAEHSVVAECLAAQRQASGPAYCVDGALAGYVVSTPATPPQVTLAHQHLDAVATVIEGDGVAALAARGWLRCAE